MQKQALTRKPRRRQPSRQAPPGMTSKERHDLLRFEKDRVWVDRHRSSLLNRYAERWIAVWDCRVIASDRDFDRLLQKVPDPPHTCFEFITRQPLEMVL
ncbi:MAG: hypothetical protein FJ291_01570 [Planctomycetes bacterium]|nr:hypothetical protein [Planctomycetota bacterium]